jgi:hypothetical protein
MMQVRLLLLAALLCLLPRAASAAGEGKYYLFVVQEQCWGTYFSTFDWLRLGEWVSAGSPLRSCVLASFKMALSYAIVLGSVAVNVLAVRKLHSQGHARGISVWSLYTQVWSNFLGAVFMALYDAPLEKYGETLVQAAGPALSVALMWRWQPPSPQHMAGILAATALIASLIFSDAIVEEGERRTSFRLCIYIASQLTFWAARVGQIYTTWSLGSDTSQVLLVLVANGLGSLVRVFSNQEIDGIHASLMPTVLKVSVFNTSLNWVMVAQWVFYNALRAAGPPPGKGAQPSAYAGVPQPPRRQASIAADKGISAASGTPRKRKEGGNK